MISRRTTESAVMTRMVTGNRNSGWVASMVWRLAHRDVEVLRGGIPVPRHLHLRVADAVAPLVDEPVEVHVRRALEGDREVLGAHRLVGVVGQEALHARPEERVAQQAAELVRHLRALGIDVSREEQLDRVAEAVTVDEGTLLVEVGRHRLPLLVEPGELSRTPATALLVLDRLHVGRQSLVEPCMRPGGRGRQVAEPLVRQFVGHQARGRCAAVHRRRRAAPGRSAWSPTRSPCRHR